VSQNMLLRLCIYGLLEWAAIAVSDFAMQPTSIH
jgi:hypothetical protein